MKSKTWWRIYGTAGTVVMICSTVIGTFSDIQPFLSGVGMLIGLSLCSIALLVYEDNKAVNHEYTECFTVKYNELSEDFTLDSNGVISTVEDCESVVDVLWNWLRVQ